MPIVSPANVRHTKHSMGSEARKAKLDYIPVRIGSLASGHSTTFDTYVKAGQRYVLYCRNGDVFELPRLGRLKEKKIESLFILPTDQIPYNLYLQENLERAYRRGQGEPIE